MTPEKATALAREIFSDEPSIDRGLKWWLFEHGTLVLSHMRSCGETQAIAEMVWLAEALGPYEGHGSQYGDVNPMSLKNHERTWLVTYPFTAVIVSLVDADDFTTQATSALPADEVVQAPSGSTSARAAIDHPKHYGGADDPYEAIKVMEAWHGPEPVYWFCLLSAEKYQSRMGKKPGEPMERDVKKAAWYMAYAVKLREKIEAEKK